MEREWACTWPCWPWAGAVRAALLALRRGGVVPRGGELRVGVILGGVERGVRLLGVEDLGELLPLILEIFQHEGLLFITSWGECWGVYDGKCQKMSNIFDKK